MRGRQLAALAAVDRHGDAAAVGARLDDVVVGEDVAVLAQHHARAAARPARRLDPDADGAAQHPAGDARDRLRRTVDGLLGRHRAEGRARVGQARAVVAGGHQRAARDAAEQPGGQDGGDDPQPAAVLGPGRGRGADRVGRVAPGVGAARRRRAPGVVGARGALAGRRGVHRLRRALRAVRRSALRCGVAAVAVRAVRAVAGRRGVRVLLRGARLVPRRPGPPGRRVLLGVGRAGVVRAAVAHAGVSSWVLRGSGPDRVPVRVRPPTGPVCPLRCEARVQSVGSSQEPIRRQPAHQPGAQPHIGIGVVRQHPDDGQQVVVAGVGDQGEDLAGAVPDDPLGAVVRDPDRAGVDVLRR